MIEPNLIVPVSKAQAEDIIRDLHAMLARYDAALFFRQEQWAVLLMIPTRARDYKHWSVVAIINSPACRNFLKALLRPGERDQAQEIMGHVQGVLDSYGAELVFDLARKGMALRADGEELAFIYHITPLGDSFLKDGIFRLENYTPPQFDEADTAAVKKYLGMK